MKRLVPSSLYGDYPAQLAHFTKPQPNGCWHFTGYVMPNGYGQMGRNQGPHRLAWELAHGRPVPAGLSIDHTCHNADPTCKDESSCMHRRCVNPAHLEAVTPKVNNLRGNGFAHTNADKTHCANGHEFTEANTYYRPDRFGRICVTCRDEALRRGRSKWSEANRERAAKARRRNNPESFEIREWAIAAGLPCSMSGPIAKAVRNAWADRIRTREQRSAA